MQGNCFGQLLALTRRRDAGTGGSWRGGGSRPPFLADQLTILQPGWSEYNYNIITAPPPQMFWPYVTSDCLKARAMTYYSEIWNANLHWIYQSRILGHAFGQFSFSLFHRRTYVLILNQSHHRSEISNIEQFCNWLKNVCLVERCNFRRSCVRQCDREKLDVLGFFHNPHAVQIMVISDG